jgi:DNA polymerase-3 subunit delta
VLALVGEELKKASPLAKACAKNGEVLEYTVPKRGLNQWIAERFRARGVRAEPDACAALLHLVGDDLRALAAEIDKLATWAGEEPLGAREVEQLVAPTAGLPTFALTDAWAQRDPARTLEASEAMLEREGRPRRDTVARLAAALAGHLGRLHEVRRLATAGVRPREAATRLRMHPFYAEKVFVQAGRFSDEELRHATVRLAELDLALKGAGRLAPELELQLALVELTARPCERRGG